MYNSPDQEEYTVNPESGFRNVVPRGREARKIEGDRHTLERKRLANRKEGFLRHTESTNPLEVSENAAGYLPDEDRFHTNVVDEEKARREYEYQRKQRIYERRRKENIEREEQRRQQIIEKRQKDEEYWKSKVGSSRANESKITYDLITLQPKDPKDFPMEQYRQEMFEYRGRQRAHNLYTKMNNSEGYNPITGERLPERISVPPKPEMPPELRRQADQE